MLHSLSLQLGDLGLQQVDHLLVVHLHPPRLLLSCLGQLDPSPEGPTLLGAEFDFLPQRKEEVERVKEGSEGSEGGQRFLIRQISQQSTSRASGLIHLSRCCSPGSEFWLSGRVSVTKLCLSLREVSLDQQDSHRPVTSQHISVSDKVTDIRKQQEKTTTGKTR